MFHLQVIIFLLSPYKKRRNRRRKRGKGAVGEGRVRRGGEKTAKRRQQYRWEREKKGKGFLKGKKKNHGGKDEK